MEKKTTLEVLAAFNCEKPQYLSNMDQNDPFAQKALWAQNLFTGGVAALIALDNRILSDLMSYTWDVFHHRHVVLAMGPNVPSLSFALAGGKDGTKALVFAPHNWVDMVKEDPLMQLGAIIFVSSQAVDYYNGILTGRIDAAIAKDRAKSYEAEYLRMMMLNHRLNEYQRSILVKYPDGFDSTKAYARKPVLATN